VTDLVGLPAGGFRLDGLVGLITGGSRNIGANIALGFAQAGADVIIVARDGKRLDDVAAQIRAEVPARRVLSIAADVGKRGDTDRIAHTALAEFGTVHVLVNNAAASALVPGTGIQDVSDEVWDEAYETNVLAPFRLTRALAPGMVEAGGGSVINVLSGSGFSPIVGEGRCAYGTTKAALWMMTRYLAVDLAPTIRVNGLVPGSISPDGEVHHRAHQERIRAIPFRRIGRPEELVGAAVYLASPAASYTSGTLLFCNGARLW
jgi:NAD(P)-dependent dehydrogenase (short-subunit alcohol dehydrogenase family)